MKSGISIAVFLAHVSNSSVTPVSSFLDACCTLLHLLVFVFQKNSQTLIKWPAKSKLITIYLPWWVVQLDWFNKSCCINKLNNPNLKCVSKSELRGDFAVPKISRPQIFVVTPLLLRTQTFWVKISCICVIFVC